MDAKTAILQDEEAIRLLRCGVNVRQIRRDRPALQAFPERTVYRRMKEIRDKWVSESETPVPSFIIAEPPTDNVPAWAQTENAPPVFRVPVVDTPSHTNWLSLSGNFVVVTCPHIPFHHAPTVERMLLHAWKEGLKRLLIIGDVYDFNQWNRKRGNQYQRRAQDDIKEGVPFFKSLHQQFEEIICLTGNHDEWLSDYMRNQFDQNFLMERFHAELPFVKWSAYGQADVVSGGKNWKALHGANYSGANPVGVAKRYASKFLANVVMGHQHHYEEGYDVSGTFQAITLGGVYDTDKLGYLHHQPRTNPNPTRSYAILKEGYCMTVTMPYEKPK